MGLQSKNVAFPPGPHSPAPPALPARFSPTLGLWDPPLVHLGQVQAAAALVATPCPQIPRSGPQGEA